MRAFGLLLLWLLWLPAGVQAEQTPQPHTLLAPEAESGYGKLATHRSKREMVVTANPLATRAAADILARGGSAVDAAITAQLVLGLVEPQSSGIGGGAFMLYWDQELKRLHAYDGRETAPQGVGERHFINAEGNPMGFFEAVVGGHAVGVPGAVKMMALVHQQHGHLPWRTLFTPAIRLAEEGFPISPRLHLLIDRMPQLAVNPEVSAYFFEEDGSPRAEGSILKNPEYAQSLRLLARHGEQVFYRGELARAMVDAVAADPNRPGTLSLDDLASYHAFDREPVCGAFRQYRVCGAPPPSSGGTTVLAILGMLQALSEDDDAAALPPDDTGFAHRFAEVSRLAYADRDHYVADPDFVDVPVSGLIDRAYLAERARLIDPQRAMTRADAGRPPGVLAGRETGIDLDIPATSHFSVVDREGNVVSMTSSIEMGFGSRIMVGGFLLNNQLTDFSFVPKDANARAIANRPEPGKRPRSSMSPTIVFADERPVLVLGSPGGNRIIAYVARVLAEVLDGRRDLPAAIAAPHVVHMNEQLELERGLSPEGLGEQLRTLGHSVDYRHQTSGIGAIQRLPEGWFGVADPRREGSAAGR